MEINLRVGERRNGERDVDKGKRGREREGERE